ncbi:5-carboxymethyl-2-hydroxymuconate semialdehyde dehydrogenase, partial [Marinovum sp. 1_MG-2023]|nr:5-carboxymethyl-2-hydroxymuconate semialdehyde dehydrogenase [Marinovum sp. 1_MG-2023]
MILFDDNLAKLEGYLARFRDTGILNRVGGQDVAGSGGTYINTSPVDTSLISDQAHGTAADIYAATNAAHDAFA